ncbi:hypothetical protein HF325_002022 [Metschnikowia pulcherrima]|uniref:Prefoldin subunit 4 n=1 Tax=Metschnikowia pulcherrima TaxID=27326 RepID=A0A8H7GTM4_9ASCO|nr:hypothetical protein HF325_002022 [Metschnikowia pulcherrima]
MNLVLINSFKTVKCFGKISKKINEFSSLINRKDALAEQLAAYKTEKEYIDDLAMEIELLDDEEKIQYKIADAFVFVSVAKAVEMIEKENELLDGKISLTEDRIDDIDSQLSMLKAHLYGKFGNSINLERD